MTQKSGSDDANPVAVGYGRPPAQTRFQSGQSGNPGGRPKGSRNKATAVETSGIYDMILAEAKRTIKVHDGGDVVSMPIAQAIMRTLGVNAVKGQLRAQKLFLDFLRVAEDDRRFRHEDWLKAAIDYKASKEAELAYLQKTGQDTAHIVPHPDDVVINMQTGEVEIGGPMTREERALWRDARALEKQTRAKIKRYVQQLLDPTLADQHNRIRAQAKADLDLIHQLSQTLGTWDR